MTFEELKKLYKGNDSIEINGFSFEISHPSSKTWITIMNIIQELDKKPELSVDIIKMSVTGWKNVKVSDVFAISEEAFIKSDENIDVDFSDESFEAFLSNSPEYIVALSNLVSEKLVKQKQKEDGRKKKSQK